MSDNSTNISVLMPVHNAGAHLQPAVDSILAQQGVTLELIIVDDHSNDSALQNLVSDHRISIIPSIGRGIVSALNTAISSAKYSFLARMDADDLAAPDRLKMQLDFLIAYPDIDICGTQVKMFNEQGQVAEGYTLYQQWINSLCEHAEIEREFFVESTIPHPSAMIRANSMNKLEGYHDSRWPEDYDLWCRALLLGMRFGKPRKPELLYWRDHPHRLSRIDERYNKQQFLRCKAHYLAKYLSQRNFSQCIIWGTGPTGLKLHDYLCEENFVVSHFIDVNPKMLGRRKRFKTVHILNIARRPGKNTSDFHSASERKDSKRYQYSVADTKDPLFTYLSEQGTIVIIAVSARGARQEIRDYLNNFGLKEGDNYLFAA